MPPSRRVNQQRKEGSAQGGSYPVVSPIDGKVYDIPASNVSVHRVHGSGGSGLGIWVFLSVVVLGAMFIFRGSIEGGIKPRPAPDGEQVVPDVKPNPQPQPSPQPAKKFEGKAIFLCPRVPMAPAAEKVIQDAHAYRDQAGNGKFNFVNPDSEVDKTENVLKSIEMAKKLGKSPPCVLWIPTTGSPSAHDWPATFESFRLEVVK